MAPDDAAEQIERFAGYLRIRDEDGRVAPLFDGEALDWTPDLAGVPDVPLPSAQVSAPPQLALPGLPRVQDADYSDGFDAAPALEMPQPPVAVPKSSPQADAPREATLPPPLASHPPFPGIEIAYAPAGSTLVSVVQQNRLEDGDVVLANPEAGLPDWASTDPEARLAALEARVVETVPLGAEALREAASDPVALRETLAELTGGRAAAGDGWAGEAASSGGVWVDGVQAEAVPERPEPGDAAEPPPTLPDLPSLPALPELPDDPEKAVSTGSGPHGTIRAASPKDPPEDRNGLEEPGQETVLGGNRSEQAATIQDLGEVGGTIMVMGDVYDLSAIWQTNMLSDADAALAAFEGALPEGGANTASNVADFEDVPSLFGPGLASHPSMAVQWEVDVVEGDLFDVNALVQHHALADGDVAVHHHAIGFSRLVLGDNESLSESALTVRADYYDVIVVGGSMVRANLIFQTNKVIDDDGLAILSAPGEDVAVGPGGNLLWNEATIRVSGEDHFAPLDDAGRAFHDALARGDEAAKEPFALPVHGGGGLPLRVLHVTGDFYDVNAISQTSIVNDVDTAIQFGRGERTLETGGNLSANAAVIVDTRGQGDVAMIGGTHYDDEMLIQTSFIAEDSDMRIVDPQTLASELVAFLDPEKLPEPDGAGPFGSILAGHEADMLGGVMT